MLVNNNQSIIILRFVILKIVMFVENITVEYLHKKAKSLYNTLILRNNAILAVPRRSKKLIPNRRRQD